MTRPCILQGRSELISLFGKKTKTNVNSEGNLYCLDDIFDYEEEEDEGEGEEGEVENEKRYSTTTNQ